MKKATSALVDSSRAQHDLQGVKMENESRRKSDSKHQATKNQMIKNP